VRPVTQPEQARPGFQSLEDSASLKTETRKRRKAEIRELKIKMGEGIARVSAQQVA
jgi:hypothetical protein